MINKKTNDINEVFNIKEQEIDRVFSYSRLSDFDRNGPSALIKRNNIHNYGAKIGSIVDDLTIPGINFNFNESYLISDCKKPTATSGKLASIILDNYKKVPNEKEIIKICKKNNFWKKSTDKNLKSKINDKNLQTYLNDYIQRNDKTIITSEDYYKAVDISDILKTHEHSKYIFENDCDKIYQYKLNFKYHNISFRGIVDIILIDHKNKNIEIIDLKTGASDHNDFKFSFVKYRYYLQEAIYTKAFKTICEDLNLKGYNLLPFQFLYIGRSEKVPVVFEISDKWHKAALEGFYINNYKYRGLNEIIEDIKWHYNNNEFKLSKNAVLNNGLLTLDDKNITINEET